MSTISTHVLDQTRGRPAVDFRVSLHRREGDDWERLAEERTDSDGRVADLVPASDPAAAGIYRLRFHTEDYFAGSRGGFYPWIDVVFELPEATEHYHVPLLLSPFGYATYRGS